MGDPMSGAECVHLLVTFHQSKPFEHIRDERHLKVLSTLEEHSMWLSFTISAKNGEKCQLAPFNLISQQAYVRLILINTGY